MIENAGMHDVALAILRHFKKKKKSVKTPERSVLKREKNLHRAVSRITNIAQCRTVEVTLVRKKSSRSVLL